MSEDSYEWIFVNRVPMLCAKIRIAKQQKIETWLHLYQVTKELGIENAENREAGASLSYIT